MRFRPVASPRLRWFAFPYAGGAASVFRPFAIGLAADVELVSVQTPGRWNRLKEPPHRRVSALVEALWPVFSAALDAAPIALWGHSLGALIAFEVARRMQRDGKPAPRGLLVSARRAPNLPPLGDPVSHLNDQQFIDAVDQRYGGISPILRTDQEMLALTLPALRGDMEMYETYVCEPGPRLGCPIVALYGGDDNIADAKTVGAWAEFTSGAFEMKNHPGKHFFPFEASARAELLQRLGGEWHA